MVNFEWDLTSVQHLEKCLPCFISSEKQTQDTLEQSDFFFLLKYLYYSILLPNLSPIVTNFWLHILHVGNHKFQSGLEFYFSTII